jgi:hypothetical protein
MFGCIKEMAQRLSSSGMATLFLRLFAKREEENYLDTGT